MKRVASIIPALIIAVALAFGIFYSIDLLLKPKPIPKLKPTSFEEADQIGAVVYWSLKRELRPASLVILGSSPWVQDYEKIWSGFMLTAYSDKNFPKVIYQDPVLKAPTAIKGLEVRQLPSALADAEIERSPKEGELHFVHTVFSESSTFFENSYFGGIQAAENKDIISLTLVPLVVNEEELTKAYPSCPIEEVAETDLEQLGCILKRASKKYFRKKLDPNKIWAVMEQHGRNEYLLFVHEPNSSYSGESF